jgi:hypothetical protein
VATPPTYADDWTAYFLTLASGASANTQTWINARLDAAYTGLDATFWGSARVEASLLLVAHAYVLESAAGASGEGPVGPVTSKSAGRWAQGNAAPASKSQTTQGGYEATLWGRRYLDLLASRGPTLGVTG